MIRESIADANLKVLEVVERMVRVAGAATVESYNAEAQTAQVRPDVLEEVVIEGDVANLPASSIFEVPVQFPGTARAGMTFGLDEGDRVLLIYRHRSHDESDAGAAPPIVPQSSRRMNPADVVAIPLQLSGQPAAHWRSDGALVIYSSGSTPIYMGASDAAYFASRDDRVQAEIQRVWDYIELMNAAALLITPSTVYVPPPPALPAGNFVPSPLGPTDSTRLKVDA